MKEASLLLTGFLCVLTSIANAADELPPVSDKPGLCSEVNASFSDVIFVRGAFNLWSKDNLLCNRGDGLYEASITMDEAIEEIQFKFAVSDWVSLICSIDSKYPCEDLNELFFEAAQ